jgi:hypothetical protein
MTVAGVTATVGAAAAVISCNETIFTTTGTTDTTNRSLDQRRPTKQAVVSFVSVVVIPS